MKNQSVRVYGIDTPECRTRDLDEKARGILAKEFVQTSLPIGSDVVIETFKDKGGKFGRILGKIKHPDLVFDLGEALLEKNLAVAYYGQSKEEIKQQHLDNKAILILEKRYTPNES